VEIDPNTVKAIVTLARAVGRFDGLIEANDLSDREPPEDLLIESYDAEKELLRALKNAGVLE